MEVPVNKIICGSAEQVLPTLPADSINCCISSPPYWALRDYGVNGQLGLEKTFEEYIDKLCSIYDEVKRVLRPDGTCWANLGDTYNNNTPGSRDPNRWPKQSRNDHTLNKRPPASVKTKSLCLIPQRFAIEMVNRGWILRNTLIWHKPNPMPSSAKDRFTVDFEYVYFFVKNKKYWFEPQYENVTGNAHPRGNGVNPKAQIGTGVGWGHSRALAPNDKRRDRGKRIKQNPSFSAAVKDLVLGRNKRTVWTIPTQPFPEAHFATYPEKLVEPMIKAGCPEFICKKCGKAREKILEPSPEYAEKLGRSWHDHKDDDSRGQRYTRDIAGPPCTADYQFKGYTDCGCNAGWRAGVVLDPFCGSGTSCMVAAQNRRDWLGIEIKQEYIDMAMRRINTAETGVPVSEQRAGQMGLFE